MDCWHQPNNNPENDNNPAALKSPENDNDPNAKKEDSIAQIDNTPPNFKQKSWAIFCMTNKHGMHDDCNESSSCVVDKVVKQFSTSYQLMANSLL